MGLQEIVLKPAYGRTYLTPADALDAWNRGFDFKIQNGPYCSIRDKNKLLEMCDYFVIDVNGEKVEVI